MGGGSWRRALALALALTGLTAAPAAADYDVVHREYVPVQNSAGQRIAVDLWLPAKGDKPVAGRFPVLIEESPYRDWSRPYKTKDDNPSNGGDPSAWARRGYVFVFADVPGTGGSQGTWCLWCRAEVDSAVSILNWAARQPWSNGKVGWYGNSYPAILGLLVAARHPPALKAVRVHSPFGDLYQDFAYIGGVQRGEDMAFIGGGFTGLDRWTGPECAPGVECDAQAFLDTWREREARPPADFTQQLYGRTTYDSWYAERSPLRAIGGIQAPTLVITGWEDMLGYGSLRVYDALRVPKRLVVAAATHVPLFPAGDALAVWDSEEARWYDHYLRGGPGPNAARPVRLFTEHGSGFREYPSWPPPGVNTKRLGLGSGSETLPIDPTSGRAGGRWLWRVLVPDADGEQLSPDGPADQDLEKPSVVTQQTEPLKADLKLTGIPRAHLRASTTAADTQLNVRLIDVDPNGFAYLVTSGWRQASHRSSDVKPQPPASGRPFDAGVTLFPLSYVFKKGHRLRVDVAFADSPRMTPPRDLGTTTIDRGASWIDLPVA